MIDPTTGEILIRCDGLRVGPWLTREEFLASSVADHCEVLVRNEPYLSFTLPTVQFDGHSFGWSVYFHGSVLQQVFIVCSHPAFGTSWSDWSEARERARCRLHDSLLESALGANWRQRPFTWGRVSSEFDRKSGGSSICVAYGTAVQVETPTPGAAEAGTAIKSRLSAWWRRFGG